MKRGGEMKDKIELFVGTVFWYLERSTPAVLVLFSIYLAVHVIIAIVQGNI
jgi:hypothetical protein